MSIQRKNGPLLLLVVVMVAASLLLGGCNNLFGSGDDDDGGASSPDSAGPAPGKVLLSASLGEGSYSYASGITSAGGDGALASSSAQAITHVAAFPIDVSDSYMYSIIPDAIEKPIDGDSISLELDDDKDYVIALLNRNAESPIELFVSVVAIGSGSELMESLPVASASTNEIDLGELTSSSDGAYAMAEGTASDYGDAFDLTIDEIYDIAESDNAITNVKNIYANYHPESGLYYLPRTGIEWTSLDLNAAVGSFSDPATYYEDSDPNGLGMFIDVTTNDVAGTPSPEDIASDVVEVGYYFSEQVEFQTFGHSIDSTGMKNTNRFPDPDGAPENLFFDSIVETRDGEEFQTFCTLQDAGLLTVPDRKITRLNSSHYS